MPYRSNDLRSGDVMFSLALRGINPTSGGAVCEEVDPSSEIWRCYTSFQTMCSRISGGKSLTGNPGLDMI